MYQASTAKNSPHPSGVIVHLKTHHPPANEVDWTETVMILPKETIRRQKYNIGKYLREILLFIFCVLLLLLLLLEETGPLMHLIPLILLINRNKQNLLHKI